MAILPKLFSVKHAGLVLGIGNLNSSRVRKKSTIIQNSLPTNLNLEVPSKLAAVQANSLDYKMKQKRADI